MRAAIATGPGRLEITDLPEPMPAADEILLEVHSVGLCGSDVHMLAGERADTGFPLHLGHEIGAVVSALPTAYEGSLQVGEVVTVNPSIPCGGCHACTRGAWWACAHFRAHGVALPGGLAPWLAVRSDHVLPVPGVPASLACLAEPLSIAAMALDRAALRGDERILVTGAGPIGLALVAMLAERGHPVAISDTLPARLQMASRLGADLLIEVGTHSVVDAVRDWSGGMGADVTFEASGSLFAAQECVELTARGGVVVIVGLNGGELRVPMSRLLFDGLRVIAARAGLFAPAVDLLSRRAAELSTIITHRFPLEQASTAFDLATDHPDEVLKVVIDIPQPQESA